MSQLALGLTHTQYSADDGGNRGAVNCARRLLARARFLQNQHIMGWGALNPEPAPGKFDFRSLDRRMRLIRSTGGIPVITLCCAPDWMKGGPPGTTDWSRIEEAPAPQHYADFAELAEQVARRYPYVKHFQVWNELKGFYDSERRRWNHEGYTELYNLVYDALKAVDPTIKVGGPYVVMDSYSSASSTGYASTVRGPWGVLDQRALDVITYWLAHKRGADFIVLDATTGTKDAGLVGDAFTATRKFSDIAAWVKQRTNLPLWWAEWHATGPRGGWDEQRRTAAMTISLMDMVKSGSGAALLWEPQGDGPGCGECLWTDTRMANGGQARPFFLVLERFTRWFPPGTHLVEVSSHEPTVLGLASSNRSVIVNTRPGRVRVELSGRSLELPPYGIAWLEALAP